MGVIRHIFWNGFMVEWMGAAPMGLVRFPIAIVGVRTRFNFMDYIERDRFSFLPFVRCCDHFC